MIANGEEKCFSCMLCKIVFLIRLSCDRVLEERIVVSIQNIDVPVPIVMIHEKLDFICVMWHTLKNGAQYL